jgi:hypothetical protein
MDELGVDLRGAVPRKLTDALAAEASVLVTMGCGEACPVVPGAVRLALFTGLFVVVAGVEKAGLADKLLGVLEPIHPESVVGLTVVTAILSNIASNVPAVMVLKSLVPHLPHPRIGMAHAGDGLDARGQPDAPGLPGDDHRRRAREGARVDLVPRLPQGRPADRPREPRARGGVAVVVCRVTRAVEKRPRACARRGSR